MPTNLDFLCRFVLIQNSTAFPANSSYDPIPCRHSTIPVDADFLQPPRFPTEKSAVSYVPLISKPNENMDFVGNSSYMDVVLLVVLNPPMKPPRFVDFFSLVV